MKKTKCANLLDLSAELISKDEMSRVFGTGVPCHPSNCDGDVHTSVNNALVNMKKYNPPEIPSRPVESPEK